MTLSGTMSLPKRPPAPVPKPVPLPRIRDELILFPELLVQWADHDAAALVKAVNEQTPLNVTLGDVRQLMAFLAENQLLRLDQPADVARALGRSQKQKRSFLEWLVHSWCDPRSGWRGNSPGSNACTCPRSRR